MKTEKSEPLDLSVQAYPASQPPVYLRAGYSLDLERVPDALEVATFEAARRQARQVRQMSRRDRYERPTNSRTTRRRETVC